MIESMKNVVEDLDLTPSEKEHVKGFFDKIHEAFESHRKSKVSDSKEKEKNDSEIPVGKLLKF